ncbi:hypothetical protein BD779DRAFT_1478769 [Infundibulicybe gibba]|nr:hypothetical protein BD779DRAFT_1478769 [Infundibulicybe gibba]
MNLNKLFGLLQLCPGLTQVLDLPKSLLFIRLASQFKMEILHAQGPSWRLEDAPLAVDLPIHVKVFLMQALGLEEMHILGCWTAFRDLIWTLDVKNDFGSLRDDLGLFEAFGFANALSPHMLFPPTSVCQNQVCPNYHQGLLRTKDKPRNVVLYTITGAHAAISVHLMCHQCSTNYHHNFSVHGGLRTYYGGVPDIIQIGEHQFVEQVVLNLFTGMMLVSWTSATNGARIYNTCLSHPENKPSGWPFDFKLRSEHVWDGFIILSLLEDFDKRDDILMVPHTGDQKDRFTFAMQEHNARIASNVLSSLGRREWKTIPYFFIFI